MYMHKYYSAAHKIILGLVVVIVSVTLVVLPASANELKSRSVSVSRSTVGVVSDYTFRFLVPDNQVIGSVAFEFCSNSPVYGFSCTSPAGLGPLFDHDNNGGTPDVLNVTSGITLANQTGNTGFATSQSDTTASRLVIKRSATAGNAVNSSYRFTNIINPSSPNITTYVRLSTYISEDATGAPNSTGGVAFVTTDSFRVDAYVPPFLIFCAGVTVSLNCNSSTGSFINLGELRSSSTTSATMQFSGATNDPSGYTTYLTGNTITSGNNIINPLASPSTSRVGVSQFGVNLRQNSSPSIGSDAIGPGSSSAASAYNSPNLFRFINGDTLSSSGTSTDFKLFTASFIVNVSPGQSPGYYATTMTYTSIASF